MVNHAYIDESGTLDHQGVMTVAMIVLEGARSAQKLHDHVMKALHPKYLQIKKMRNERSHDKYLPYLHFADMSSDQKRAAARRLAQAKVTVVTAHYRHHGDKTHTERFTIYTNLVKICIRKALQEYRELTIGIAKQGGWQKYERDFYAQLRALTEGFDSKSDYRKADFELLSASNPGIQLADFYVGALRAYVMHESACMPFDPIIEQVISNEFYTIESVECER